MAGHIASVLCFLLFDWRKKNDEKKSLMPTHTKSVSRKRKKEFSLLGWAERSFAVCKILTSHYTKRRYPTPTQYSSIFRRVTFFFLLFILLSLIFTLSWCLKQLINWLKDRHFSNLGSSCPQKLEHQKDGFSFDTFILTTLTHWQC